MKTLLKIGLQILLINTIFFTSCDKSTYNGVEIKTPEPMFDLLPCAPHIDSLSGQEFIYHDLTWQSWTGGEPVVKVELPSSNLFLNRGIKVSILDDFHAIEVPYYTMEYGMGTFALPCNKGFIYDNSYFNSLILFAIGANKNQLIGTSVSIKVEIL